MSEIAAHNFGIFDVKNIDTIPEDGISFLTTSNSRFDWIFIDPSRRNDSKDKVFKLADCQPNVAQHLDFFFEKSDNILLKTSPLLDISKGIADLNNVHQIHIIAVNNEVKELLWVLKRGYCEKIDLKTINIQKRTEQKFEFVFAEEKNTNSSYSRPLSYLYEPNAAVMKSGGFNTIGAAHSFHKLHKNTHLYTSENQIDFPGRCFKVVATYPYNVKAIKKLGFAKANITRRNFPHSVAFIRKQLKIKDGSENFLFFVTDFNENLLLIQCLKM